MKVLNGITRSYYSNISIPYALTRGTNKVDVWNGQASSLYHCILFAGINRTRMLVQYEKGAMLMHSHAHY